MRQRHNLHLAAGEQRVEMCEVERAVCVEFHAFDDAAFVFREQVPRNEIAVVFHGTDEDFVARSEKFPAVSVRDEIDRFGGVFGPNRFFGSRGIDELRDFSASGFVDNGRAFGEDVESAVDVGVAEFVVVRHRVDDGFGLLRCGCRVEVNERLSAVNRLIQNRKFAAVFQSVEVRVSGHQILILESSKRGAGYHF